MALATFRRSATSVVNGVKVASDWRMALRARSSGWTAATYTVKRVGRDFAGRPAARAPGDPAAIVADGQRLRTQLGGARQFDERDTIVDQAHA